MVKLQTDDIQGMILTGYSHLLVSKYLFLEITEVGKAKGWLNAIAPQITTAHWKTGANDKVEKPPYALNIAFTYPGLEKLGLPPESLNTFPTEFIEGMGDEPRSRQLGDWNGSEPTHWEFGAPVNAIHILLILQTSDKETLETLGQEYLDQIDSSQGIKQVHTEEGYIPEDGKEHFGFRDSIAQPEIEGSPKPTKSLDLVKPGEFILGYKNEDGNYPPTPTVHTDADPNQTLPPVVSSSKSTLKDLGRNGSYLVFRKMHQDVAGFRRYFRDNFPDPAEQTLMAAKTVGRWPSGAPLTLAPDQDNDPSLHHAPKDNAFLYMDKDPHGYACPMASHIRRTNPRDSLGGDPADSLKNVNRRRIIRRGAVYGPRLPEGVFEDDQTARGLLFICLNANIRSQFEFIQQQWVNNDHFGGTYKDKDPLIGINPPNQTSRQMTISQPPVRQKLTGLPNFVAIKGGGYFFLPGKSAVHFLAGGGS